MTLFHYMYVCYLQMAPGRLTRSRGEASILVVRSTVQSTETPPEVDDSFFLTLLCVRG